MEILETKGRKMNKIKREEREDLHTFSDTTTINRPLRLLTVCQNIANKLPKCFKQIAKTIQTDYDNNANRLP